MPSTHDYIDDKRNNNIQVYINGKFYHRAIANISVMDSGFLLGDGVWEGIRLHKNVLVHLNDHLIRLYNGAKSIAMAIPISKEKMKSEIMKTIKTNCNETLNIWGCYVIITSMIKFFTTKEANHGLEKVSRRRTKVL